MGVTKYMTSNLTIKSKHHGFQSSMYLTSIQGELITKLLSLSPSRKNTIQGEKMLGKLDKNSCNEFLSDCLKSQLNSQLH